MLSMLVLIYHSNPKIKHYMNIITLLQSDDFFYLNVFLKLLLGLLAIILIINKSGKGNLAPTSPMDQVQNYVLGGIIGGVIYSPSISILLFAVVLTIWALLIIGLRKLKSKNHTLKTFIDGSPIVLIKHGVVDVDACRKAKITANEIAFKLRREGVYYVRNVKRAVFEQNGELTIVLRGEENPKYPIITDGLIQASILDDVGKTEEWLIDELKKEGYESATDIFLAEYDSGTLKLIPYPSAEKENN